MGQQQLLLLVLATVIVGLATVAGIEAFDENQEQAAEDALVQRALTVASQIKAAANKPAQLGGVDLSNDSNRDLAEAAGFDVTTGGGAGIPAEAAGNGATCDIGGQGSTDGGGNASRDGSNNLEASVFCSVPGGPSVVIDIEGGQIGDANINP